MKAPPTPLRGTAFGLFNLCLALLLGNAVAGAVWAGFGSTATFATGAVLASLALIATFVRHNRKAA